MKDQDLIHTAIPSNGIHSNGYSLRSVIEKKIVLQNEKDLLRPTKIYSREI